MSLGSRAFEINNRWASVALAATVAMALIACNHNAKDDSQIPETRHPDWETLQSTIVSYDQGRADETRRMTMAALNTFRYLSQNHSGDRIGEESLYYVGRIYYDIRDYHDARLAFYQFREAYPESEFLPTVANLEAEMDADTKKYNDWIDESRVGAK